MNQTKKNTQYCEISVVYSFNRNYNMKQMCERSTIIREGRFKPIWS